MPESVTDGDDPTNVRGWFHEFWLKHKVTHPIVPSWKEQESPESEDYEGAKEIYRKVRSDFIRMRVTFHEAGAATGLLIYSKETLRFRNDHPKALRGAIEQMRAAAPPLIPGATGNTWGDRHRYKQQHKEFIDWRNARWAAMPEAEREAIRAAIREETPSLTRLPKSLDMFAKERAMPEPELLDESATVPLTDTRNVRATVRVPGRAALIDGRGKR